MKKIIIILMLCLFASTVVAEKVFVLSLHYKDEKITMLEQTVKTGHFPDRRLQPEQGITGEIISDQDEILYSFKFDLPLRIYTDVIDNAGNIDGGVIILNETDFALVLPYYDNAKEIRFYDKKENEILTASLTPAFSPLRMRLIVPISIVVLVLIVVFTALIRRRK